MRYGIDNATGRTNIPASKIKNKEKMERQRDKSILPFLVNYAHKTVHIVCFFHLTKELIFNHI